MQFSVTRLRRFRRPAVVARFAKDHGTSLVYAGWIFEQTKLWLWLGSERLKDRHAPDQLAMFSEIRVLDDMWHTFLLFTKDYQDFCEKYLGAFVHHVPTPPGTRSKIQRQAILRSNFEYIHDKLGARTLINWCERLPQIKKKIRKWPKGF